MKSLFWLPLMLLVPLSVWSQDRLQFQAEITLHDTGSWSGWSKWHPDEDYGGPESRTLHLRFNDTLSINGDSIFSASPQKIDLTASINRDENMIRNLQITGHASNQDEDFVQFAFHLLIDSLPFQKSGSLLIIPKGYYPCQASSTYSFGHPGPPYGRGPSDMTGCSGSGGDTALVLVFVPFGKSSVAQPSIQTHIQITSTTHGTILIEGEPYASGETIEIFNTLGQKIYKTTYTENAVQVTDLSPGCYFARIGNVTAKFAVTQ
jgi:hypothetical protein